MSTAAVWRQGGDEWIGASSGFRATSDYGWPIAFYSSSAIELVGFVLNLFACAAIVAATASCCERCARRRWKVHLSAYFALVTVAALLLRFRRAWGTDQLSGFSGVVMAIGLGCTLFVAGRLAVRAVAGLIALRLRGTPEDLQALFDRAATKCAAYARKLALPLGAASIVFLALSTRNDRYAPWPFSATGAAEVRLNTLSWLLLLAATFRGVRIVRRRIRGGQFHLRDIFLAISVACVVLALGRIERPVAEMTHAFYSNSERSIFYHPLRDRAYPISGWYRPSDVPWYVCAPIAFGVGCGIHVCGCVVYALLRRMQKLTSRLLTRLRRGGSFGNALPGVP